MNVDMFELLDTNPEKLEAIAQHGIVPRKLKVFQQGWLWYPDDRVIYRKRIEYEIEKCEEEQKHYKKQLKLLSKTVSIMNNLVCSSQEEIKTYKDKIQLAKDEKGKSLRKLSELKIRLAELHNISNSSE